MKACKGNASVTETSKDGFENASCRRSAQVLLIKLRSPWCGSCAADTDKFRRLTDIRNARVVNEAESRTRSTRRVAETRMHTDAHGLYSYLVMFITVYTTTFSPSSLENTILILLKISAQAMYFNSQGALQFSAVIYYEIKRN